MPVPTQNITRQNTIALAAGTVTAYQFMVPQFGAQVLSWDLFNAGPSDLWLRWDQIADAAPNDPGSLWLPAGIGFTAAITSRMTVATDQATTLVFVVNDR